MKTLTYNLIAHENSSNNFYSELSSFTATVLAYPDNQLRKIVTEMEHVYGKQQSAKVRTNNEYLFELLMLGIFWINYGGVVLAANRPKLQLLKALYKIRKKKFAAKTFGRYGARTLNVIIKTNK